MSLSVITTNNATGTQLVTVRPVSVEIGQVFTLSLFGVEVSFEATAATAANVVAGLLAAIEASADPEWSLVDSTLNYEADALLISYSVTAGTLRIWRGDAPAVAQITHITPANVEIGDVFTVAMNGKTISVTATAATAANVVAKLVTAISGTEIPEFREVSASNGGSFLILTSTLAGRPFEVTAASSNGSELGVDIVTTAQGSAAVSPVNQTQSFAIPITAGGTFKIYLGGVNTADIAVGASAATIQTALQGLATVGSGNVLVSKTTDANDDTYTATFQGALAATNVAQMIVVLNMTKPIVRTIQQGSSTGTLQNEIQTVTFPDTINFDSETNETGVDSYTLTLDGSTTSAIYPDAVPSIHKGFLQSILNTSLTDADVEVTADGNVLTFEFVYREGSANQSQLVASAFAFGYSFYTLAIPVTTTQAAVSTAAAVNETQTVTLTGMPTGGTFTLTFDGDTTAAIAWNATAGAVETALEALGSIGSGNANVSGSAGGPWTVEFAGSLGGANQPALTADAAGLTGGSLEGITVTTATASAGPNHWDTAANWTPAGVPVDFDRARFEFGSSDVLYGLDQSGITLTELEISLNFTGSIGLPRLNDNGYLEYRTRDLTLNCPSILIGHGNGSGSGKIQLNTLETTVWMEIRNTGGTRESGVPALTWYGNNEASEILLINGDFGTAIWSDQLATLNKIQQFGGTLRLDHAVLNALYSPNQAISAHETTLGGKPLEL